MFKTLLKGSTVSKKLLTLIAILGLGSMQVMAQTVIGGKKSDTEWYGWSETASQAKYTIAANKTLTLTFTVTDYSGDWAGYVVSLAKKDVAAFGGDDGYLWFRSPDFAWYKTNWVTGAVVSNTNTLGGMTQSDWQAFVKGATTVMAIQRFGTQVFVNTKVTKDGTSYEHNFVQEIGTTSDINAFLCGDAASISIASAETTETEGVGETTVMLGSADNTAGFAVSPVTMLKPESTLTMNFTNYSAADVSFHNYGIELNYNGYYANIVLGGGRWGELLVDDKNNELVTTPEINKEEAFNAFADFNNKMNGADVTLTIARSGRVVTITAVNTPADKGTPFVLKYTLEPNKAAFPNFATEDIAVNLSTDGSHITYKFPIENVNAEVSKYGWSTFSSDYKVDFTDVTGVEAYAVTGHDGNAIALSEALGVVNAGQGVLLKAVEGDAPTFFTLPLISESGYSGANLLKAGTGAAVAAENGKTKYVLSVNDGKAEFQKINTAPATVAAGKAYLEFDKVISAPALSLDLGTTAIKAVESRQAAEGFFNLAGQRVAQPKKGLYIVNGKKIIVK